VILTCLEYDTVVKIYHISLKTVVWSDNALQEVARRILSLQRSGHQSAVQLQSTTVTDLVLSHLYSFPSSQETISRILPYIQPDLQISLEVNQGYSLCFHLDKTLMQNAADALILPNWVISGIVHPILLRLKRGLETLAPS